jgi:hypothetical protein
MTGTDAIGAGQLSQQPIAAESASRRDPESIRLILRPSTPNQRCWCQVDPAGAVQRNAPRAGQLIQRDNP